MLEGALAEGCTGVLVDLFMKKHRPVFILQLIFDPESSKRNEGVTPQICRCITCFSHMYQCATIFGTGEMQVATPMAPHIGTLKKKKGGPKSSHIREILAKKHDEIEPICKWP